MSRSLRDDVFAMSLFHLYADSGAKSIGKMHRKSARTEGKGGRREILPAPLVLRKRACLLDAGHTAAESLNVQGNELGLGRCSFGNLDIQHGQRSPFS